MDSTKQQVEVERQLLEDEVKSLDKLLAADDPVPKDIRLQFEFVEARHESFYRVLANYYSLLLKNDKHDDYKSEKEKENKILKKRMQLKFLCSPYIDNRASATGGAASSSTMTSSGGGSNPDHYHIRLPKRELPSFGGDVVKWLPFWSAFQEIHLDSKIPNAEKFHYLLQCTVPGSHARKVVESFPMTADNYPLVVQAMSETFGRKKMLVKVYIREMLKLVVAHAKGNPNLNFVELVATLTGHLRNLETLEVTSDVCGVILYPIVESCIPRNILNEWMKSNDYKEELESLMSYLRSEVRREMETQLAQDPFMTNEKNSKANKGKDGKQDNKEKAQEVPTLSSFLNNTGPDKCVFCDGGHQSAECFKAVNMTLAERQDAIKSSKELWCFKCVKKGHPAKKCRSSIKCFLCTKSHHTLMCRSNGGGGSISQTEERSNSTKAKATTEVEQVSTLSNFVESSLVPLQTLRLIVYGPTGKQKEIRAIIDGGNQRCYVKKELATFLELKTVGEETYSEELFGAIITAPATYQKMNIIVSDINGKDKCEFIVSPKERIASKAAVPFRGPWVRDFENRGIKFTDLNSKYPDIELLLGNKLTHSIMTGRKCSLSYGPGALETRWGWVLSGELPANQQEHPKTAMLVTSLYSATRPLADLWELEALGIEDSATTQSRKELEEATQKHFDETVLQQEDGRYEVHLPFISGARKILPTNELIAKRRLESATKKLCSSGHLEAYDNVFKQWEEEDIIETVSSNPRDGVHYLPHRAVFKENSTTPLRPVFDASCKERDKVSLNECLERGPNTLELIPKILTRFRFNKVGVISDIRKAFQQISVVPEHRGYLRFLWWADLTCKQLKVYQHKRVVFGVTSSPYLLGATLQYHLNKNPSENAETATLLKRSLYVDNCVSSLPSYESAVKFKEECIKLLLPAKFDLRGWVQGPSREEARHAVLGLIWNTQSDTLSFDTSSLIKNIEGPATQRRLLSLAHSLYDPMGWLAPFTLMSRLLLRECHKNKVGWDKELEEPLYKQFWSWVNQLPGVEELSIKRYIGLDTATAATIHVFSDASHYAYAAAVYLRVNTVDGVKVFLIEAKAKVSPLKNVTIPRLELLSCLIAARLTRNLKESLHQEIPITFWSDSATALAWIRGVGPWATFVHNRVNEIKQLTKVQQWRHIPGSHNPADLPSRGCSMKKLLESRWWEGPRWLQVEEEKWPISKESPIEEEVVREMKKSVVSLLTCDTSSLEFLLNCRGYDSTLKVLAYILRFVEHCQDPERRREITEISLNLQEIEKTETFLIQHIQSPIREDQSQIRILKPFLDKKGILRITSRLTHEDEHNFKYPIVLPEKNPFVKMLIMKYHFELKHAGVTVVLGKLRENFWLINGRRETRRVVNGCVVCRRYSVRKVVVPEAPLPSIRTATAAPFSTTGIDMAGPLILRGGEKVYIALFTCSVYRGVHLELVRNMSTEAFMEAFRRFTSRRGRPNIVYTDNGLNFVGASRTFKEIDWKKITEYATINRICWRFNPPAAAWWGGWWERLIGLMKQLLIRNLGKKTVNADQLTSLLYEVENVMNSRPLTYISEDIRDPSPMTPNHFLRNGLLSFLPEADVRDGGSTRRAFAKLQKLRESLRGRFRREYLGQLLHNHSSKKIELKEGDVVLLEQDNVKRVEWPLAVIDEVIRGRDGIPRTYRVRTKHGTITRAAQRLYPLEVQENEEEQSMKENN